MPGEANLYLTLQSLHVILKSRLYSSAMRKKILLYHYTRLFTVSLFIGLVCAILAESLKRLTEHTEHFMYNRIEETEPLLLFMLPSVGITIIYFLRKYLFKNRKNKGITEIYKTLDQRKDHLPLFKIPSHYINGFLTVIFGGSTGIEVSTVVATATVGNAAYERGHTAFAYKKELVCAGVAAGVAVLFGSPLAGWLFAVEVIARKVSKTILISCTAAALVAGLWVHFFDAVPLLPFAVNTWKLTSIPFYIILGALGGLLAVYTTILVIRVKELFASIHNNFIRVNLGALMVGSMIYSLPYLFGDSYHGLKEVLNTVTTSSFDPSFLWIILLLVILKPVAASLTLGAGGDGGVFAPSIVAGSFLGILFAICCNYLLGTQLVLLNFALVGAAATLAAAIHAPLTALFLVCSLVPNGYHLFTPVLLGSYVGKICAAKILPYNVYTYHLSAAKNEVPAIAGQS